jgi:hypothetical protein
MADGYPEALNAWDAGHDVRPDATAAGWLQKRFVPGWDLVPVLDLACRDAGAGKLACRAQAFRRAEAQPDEAQWVMAAERHTPDAVQFGERSFSEPAPRADVVSLALQKLVPQSRLARRFRCSPYH